MIKTKIFTILAVIIMTYAVSSDALAERGAKPWVWGWYESHWKNLDFEPHLESGKHPHNSQWNYDDWKSGHWMEQKGDGMKLVDGFYKSDIIRDQKMENDLPVLVIGPNFYNLGGQDKRRVIQVIDEVYGVTGSKIFGSFMLHDWQTDQPIGAYTQYGLQLQ